MLFSNILEDLLLVTNDIYRINYLGFHKLDFQEDASYPVIDKQEQPVLKIEKIETKHEDKTILFNPPEIDYIESISGTV